MAELGFRYAPSPDGTSIAYARLGAGPALVIVPPIPFSNVSAEWSLPLMRGVYERLAQDFELILYDGRGTGASQRRTDDLTVATLAGDLGTVMDAVDIDRAALLAMYLSVPPAVTFASEQPDRVSHLALFGAVVHGGQALDRPGTAALLTLIDEDWELFTRTAALDWMGWGAGDGGEHMAQAFRTTTTPLIAKAALAEYAKADLTARLAAVSAPTLVLHRRDSRQIEMEASAALAAALADGRLAVLDGASATLFFDDPDGTADLIARFIRPDHVDRPRPATSSTGLVPTAPSAGLSPREREVLRLIAAGETNGQIAARLGLSVHTVERHAANIYRKIDARGRADATAWALRNGLG